MNFFRTTLVLCVSLQWSFAIAQSGGEANEPSPEALDAAFTSEDAAREAAAFSDAIIGQGAVDPLQAMTDAADLVFRGSVTSQSVVYDASGIPWTHTTLAIEAILRGSYPGGEITLIQEGGPARDRDDKILMVSSSLLFNLGDEELLFVDLDADNPNPRARAIVNQRYRIYEGRVYSEDGRGITVEPVERGSGRRLVLSDDHHPAAYFTRIQIGDHTLTRNVGPDRRQTDGVTGAVPANTQMEPVVQSPVARSPVLRSYSDSVDVQTFSDAIAQ